MELVVADFKSSFDALYEGCDQLAINLLEELTAMGAFKAKYTAPAVAAFQAEVQAARLLPDEEQRAEAHELMRIELTSYTDKNIRPNLSALKLYIRDAYDDPEVRAVKLTAAGYNDWEKALKYNWELLRTVMQKADTFIGANLTDLLANDNMPAMFPPKITDGKTFVNDKVPVFLNARENAPQGTQEKIVQSNKLYEIAISICEDGQHVFESNPAKQKQFVWDAIMEIVTPAGKAGLRFDVKDSETSEPIKSVVAKIKKEGNPPISVTTDDNGKGVFDNLPAGDYAGTVELLGYVTLNVSVTINTGVTSFKHWLMVKNP